MCSSTTSGTGIAHGRPWKRVLQCMSKHAGLGGFAIDVSRERILSFGDTAKFVGKLRGTKRVAFQTLHRWATKGCRGVVLQTLFVGGARCTSVEALQRFFAAVTEARSGAAEPHAERCGPDLGDVDAVLRNAGIADGGQ